eukprot:TRINITY_DN67219_c0_g1_i1.p1 TRINITY_DN67219_c0_g1~~TRINITY_DN67219_c0_g1_i1.p1  ORF type:complete len:564 (+),score=83.67 TRINITY_DN67219_c0_g1_i1:85-1776(+)
MAFTAPPPGFMHVEGTRLGAELRSLSGTMQKLREDEERLGNNTCGVARRNWVYVEDPPEGMSPRIGSGHSLVQVLLGPVIGTVTETSAVVMLEVDTSAAVTLVLTRSFDDGSSVVRKLQRRLHGKRPGVFDIRDLEPGTLYEVSFEGLAVCELQDLSCVVRTLPRVEDIQSLTVFAMSCDRPEVIDQRREENPWARLASFDGGPARPTVVLHLGGQVHTMYNGTARRACRLVQDHSNVPPAVAGKMRHRALERVQETYRDTWNEESTRVVLARWQHMMLWSDNDIADEFTTFKDAQGEQAYNPEFLKAALRCYRMYQRQLWDPLCEGNMPRPREPLEEWQFRALGRVGVFLIDTRGSRITSAGRVVEGPLLTDRQRADITKALNTPGLLGFIVGSELPLIVESPAEITQMLSYDPNRTYLTDHWAYRRDELEWLLEAVFDWRSAVPGREALFLSGGLNCGVESTIHDKKTGAVLRQITTSPMTSFTSPFDADTSGEICHRFFYRHKPLPQRRNFCAVDVQISEEVCTMTPELVIFDALELATRDRMGMAPSAPTNFSTVRSAR